MEKNAGASLLDLATRAEPIAQKLRSIASGKYPIQFSHVIASAQPFLSAIIALGIPKTLWVVCQTVRAQELYFESIVNWLPHASFLPEAEFAAVENILPDPEIAAERLALLSLVENKKAPRFIVITRAALDQPAPGPGTLRSSAIELQRGASIGLEKLLTDLTRAGYERVPQISTRGHLAVRGGIVDVFSWQAPLPLRMEFFGDEIESLREFDLDTQVSVRTLERAEILLSAAEDSSGKVRDYIQPDHLVVELEPEVEGGAPPAQIQIGEGWLGCDGEAEDFAGAFVEPDIAEFGSGDFMLAEVKRAQFAARLKQWREMNATVAIYFQTEGEIERFHELMGSTPSVAAVGACPELAERDRRKNREDDAGRRLQTAATDALAGVQLLEGTLSRGHASTASGPIWGAEVCPEAASRAAWAQ